jgi:hypothetical protein
MSVRVEVIAGCNECTRERRASALIRPGTDQNIEFFDVCFASGWDDSSPDWQFDELLQKALCPTHARRP